MKVECGAKRLIEFNIRWLNILYARRDGKDPSKHGGEIADTIQIPFQIIEGNKIDLIPVEKQDIGEGIGMFETLKVIKKCTSCLDNPQRKCDLSERFYTAARSKEV